MIEPYSIMNPTRKLYKFLYQESLDECTSESANRYINLWLAEKGWTIKRQKQYAIPEHNMFEIRVWLN